MTNCIEVPYPETISLLSRLIGTYKLQNKLEMTNFLPHFAWAQRRHMLVAEYNIIFLIWTDSRYANLKHIVTPSWHNTNTLPQHTLTVSDNDNKNKILCNQDPRRPLLSSWLCIPADSGRIPTADGTQPKGTLRKKCESSKRRNAL